MKPYFICTTPRTGSNLLCEALVRTEVAGKPDEYFGHMHVPRWKKKWGTQEAIDYVKALQVEAQTENGVWAVKVMMQYFDDLHSFLLGIHNQEGCSKLEIIERTFGECNYVWMTRRDKIAQAISLHKAYQNFVWAVEKDSAFPNEDELIYDSEKIDQILFEIVKNEAEWEEYFLAIGKRPYVVVYEDFVENYQSTVNAVLKYLGIEHRFYGKLEESRLQKQSNSRSGRWKLRYIEEKQKYTQVSGGQ